MSTIKQLIEQSKLDTKMRGIALKVANSERISTDEGLYLYEKATLDLLSLLANEIRERFNGKDVYFNRNIHIEPTNICVYTCKFCSYRRSINEEGAWEYSIEDVKDLAKAQVGKNITEVHIVGGVHPHRDLDYYGNMIQEVKKMLPGVHVKGFTAVELDYMIQKSGLSLSEGLSKLKAYGLDSIPGGGAEIFDEELRKKVCGGKSTTQMWLDVHETAHRLGIPSNATILYGHIETYAHRIDHLNRLRELQDRTHGFNTFIPLKFKKANNSMEEVGEVSTLEDLRNYAVSRIFLDNIPHLKAYWPMIGKSTTQLSLSFGVDDIDGTIDDSTKIYSMAGADDKNPALSTEQLVEIIRKANRTPVERDTVYNKLKIYDGVTA